MSAMNDSCMSAGISDEEYHDHVDTVDSCGSPAPRDSGGVLEERRDEHATATSSLLKLQLSSSCSLSSSPQQQQQVSVTVESGGHTRILSFPVTALQQREREMNQTALRLDIPPERWSGSRLYKLWKQQQEHGSAVAPFCKITLQPDMVRTVVQPWASRRCAALDWIQNYYHTGKLQIPSTARGYDILAAVEYFEILYQPDQCHFASRQVYKRVQQWSRYLCHRAALTAWVLTQCAAAGGKHRKLSFGTSSPKDDGSSMELGTKPLPCLGDWQPLSPGSKKSLAQIAYALFNSRQQQQLQPQQSQPSARDSIVDDSSSMPSAAQEEDTAHEIRTDFCSYLQDALLASSSKKATVKFSVKPVTVRLERQSSSSLSSAQQLQQASPSVGGCGSSCGGDYSQSQTLQIVNRAVLVIDWSTPPAAGADELEHQERTKSDLSAPVDEYVEEELAKGRLEELVQQVDARNKSHDDSGDGSPTSVVAHPRPRAASHDLLLSNSINKNEQRKSARIGGVKWMDEMPSQQQQQQQQLEPRRLTFHDTPDDEAQEQAGGAGAIGPPTTHYKKKKKKPVFEFPDKLLTGEGDNKDDVDRPIAIPEAQPVVKSPPLPSPKSGGASTPPPTSSIAIVRSSTYDNTVTSALTGPFYVDEKGNLRDVFEEKDGADADDDDGWDDEDTRAQARRHDWVQTALMNRGIDERVEALLNADENGDTTDNDNNLNDRSIGDDAWEWLTGLGVCEFSRSMVESMERQFVRGSDNGDKKSACPPAVDCGFGRKPEASDGDPSNPLCDGCAHPTDPSQVQGIPDAAVNTASSDLAAVRSDRDDSGAANGSPPRPATIEEESHDGSTSSKESPRDVYYKFDRAPNGGKLSPPLDVTAVVAAMEPSAAADPPAAGEDRVSPLPSSAPTSPSRKIGRGIKSLFRRRRPDNK